MKPELIHTLFSLESPEKFGDFTPPSPRQRQLSGVRLHQVLFLNSNFIFPVHAGPKGWIRVLNGESICTQVGCVYFVLKTYPLKMDRTVIATIGGLIVPNH